LTNHIALRCPSYQAAEAAAACLDAEAVRRVVPLHAVAVMWVDRDARCQVRHVGAPAQRPGHSWATWMFMSAAMWSGGYVHVALQSPEVGLSERVDDAVVASVAPTLAVGEAAVVVTLTESTPLLLVEALRPHARGLAWSTLPACDEALVAAALGSAPTV